MARTLLGPAALALLMVACFRGEGTIGAACRDDADCGAEQSCTNEVCGYCGDGIPQRRELCSVPAAALGSAPATQPGQVLALDLEPDGALDLITRGEAGPPQWWRGDGEGGFAVASEVEAGGQRGPVRLAALDEDEPVDLVVVDADAPALHLGYGDGSTGWAFEPAVMLAAEPLDVAVASAPWDGPAWVAWTDAEGLWQAPVDPQTRTLGEAQRLDEARSLRLGGPAPLDEGEALDLAVLDLGAGRLEPWMGDGSGGLVPGESLALEGPPLELRVLDVDGDGDPDILVMHEDGGLTVVLSDGQGALTITERLSVPGPVRDITVGDLNRDSLLDLVLLADAERPGWVFLARGALHPDGLALNVGEPGSAVLAVDIDSDGLTEVLLGPTTPGPLRVVEVAP